MTIATAAGARIRGRTRKATMVQPASSTAPITPSGHGRAAPGRSAKVVATWAIHPVGHEAAVVSQSVAPGAQGARSAAISASAVAGTRAGRASTLAGTAYVASSGVNKMITGAQQVWAAAGTATACANGVGRKRASLPAHGWANSTSPPVASTDSAKP